MVLILKTTGSEERMKKKIALAVPTLADGGAERIVSVWANELRAKGYDVSIVLFHRSDREYDVRPDIPMYSLTKEKSEYQSMNPLKKYFGLRSILKQIDADYIISFLPRLQAWVMLTSWGLKAKRIETLRDNPHHGIMYTNLLYRIGWRLCFLTGHKIILQTRKQLRFFGEREQKKCVIIPNQISERFIRHFRQEEAEKPAEFVAVGRFAAQKNYRMMISAFARACRHNDDIRLRIFGKGDAFNTAEIQGWIEAAGMQNRIHLMGWTPHLEEEYKKSDFFLMTSNHEGLPNALIEAMASRLICISTDCETGPGDLIDHGVTGFLVPVGDSTGFADAIEKALKMSAEERIAMADAARSRILEYCSLKNSADALCRCFDE